jgi:hypothetical protein
MSQNVGGERREWAIRWINTEESEVGAWGPAKIEHSPEPRSSRLAIIVLQKTAEFLVAPDIANAERDRGWLLGIGLRQCAIIPSLVRTMPVVEFDVLGHDVLQVFLAEADEMIQAFQLDRLHEPLGECVQVRLPRPDPHDFRSACVQGFAERKRGQACLIPPLYFARSVNSAEIKHACPLFFRLKLNGKEDSAKYSGMISKPDDVSSNRAELANDKKNAHQYWLAFRSKDGKLNSTGSKKLVVRSNNPSALQAVNTLDKLTKLKQQFDSDHSLGGRVVDKADCDEVTKLLLIANDGASKIESASTEWATNEKKLTDANSPLN